MSDFIVSFDVDAIAEGMGLDASTVIERMKDSRTTAPWMEERIRQDYYDGAADSKGIGDVESQGSVAEFKGLSRYGVRIVPSGMVGKGRSVDWDELDQWLEEMDGGFIIHDNTQFPDVACWHIDAEVVRGWILDEEFNSGGGLTYNRAIELLG